MKVLLSLTFAKRIFERYPSDLMRATFPAIHRQVLKRDHFTAISNKSENRQSIREFTLIKLEPLYYLKIDSHLGFAWLSVQWSREFSESIEVQPNLIDPFFKSHFVIHSQSVQHSIVNENKWMKMFSKIIHRKMIKGEPIMSKFPFNNVMNHLFW